MRPGWVVPWMLSTSHKGLQPYEMIDCQRFEKVTGEFLKMTRENPLIRLWIAAAAALVSCTVWPAAFTPQAGAQDRGGFKVIVNASNPTAEKSRKELGRIFLKKQEEWPNGFAITVVDLRPDDPARAAFSRAVLQKEPTAVEAYWSKLIFSGMGVPPVKLASSVEVVDFVGQNVGSIGYVSADTRLSESVKELEVGP